MGSSDTILPVKNIAIFVRLDRVSQKPTHGENEPFGRKGLQTRGIKSGHHDIYKVGRISRRVHCTIKANEHEVMTKWFTCRK